MGNITIQGDLTGDVPGGEVGGASNLTTVGAIPYVSAAGILNQDPTALFWDAANNRLGVGTASPRSSVDVFSDNPIFSQSLTAGGFAGINTYTSTGVLSGSISYASSSASFLPNSFFVGSRILTSPTIFVVGDSEAARFAATTRNLLIGTTTDSNFKLDVAASGSAGTARFYGGSGVSDTTKVVVQAGGGQSATNLTEWQNSGGTLIAGIDASGGMYAPNYYNIAGNWRLSNNAMDFGSAFIAKFSSTTSSGGASDLSLSRASAGVLQVGDGGSNANGTVLAARVGVASSPLGSYALTVDQTGYWLAAIGAVGIRSDAAEWTITSSTRDITIGRDFGLGPLRIQARTDPYTVNIGKYSNRTTGTVNIEDATPTTGVTRAVIRAGAGQSTTNLTEWQNSAGTTVLLSIGPGGVISAQGNVLGITNTAVSTIQLGSTYGLGWSSTGTYGGAKDVAITRNAAGVIEVNNGTAGTYRDLILRRSQHNGVTVADLPAAAAGNAGSIQYVTDANATTIGSTVAGGGANKVMVWSDGAAWKIFAS